jgi:hypothetical protein
LFTLECLGLHRKITLYISIFVCLCVPLLISPFLTYKQPYWQMAFSQLSGWDHFLGGFCCTIFFSEGVRSYILSKTTLRRKSLQEKTNNTKVFEKLRTIFLLHPSTTRREQTTLRPLGLWRSPCSYRSKL